MESSEEEINIFEGENFSTQTVVRDGKYCKMLKASFSTPLLNRRRFSQNYSFFSRVFTCKNNRDIEWTLAISHNIDPDVKNYLSLFLRLQRSTIPQLQVFFKCTLKRDKEKIASVEEMCTLYLPAIRRVCIPRFVKTKALPSVKLRNIELTCKIRALPKVSLSLQKNILASDLHAILRDQTLTDVTLVASDNRELKVHKAILAARSPVFAKMFEHEMREKLESRVLIEDIEYDVLSAFVGFAYTAQLEGNLEPIASALIIAAEKYQFEELRKAASHLMLRRINVNNAISTLQLAERYNWVDLKQSVIDFINSHAKSIVNTPAFKSLTTTQAHLIAEIYSVMAMAVNDNKNSAAQIKRLGR